MATGTFTFNALGTKTRKERTKNTKKNCKSFKLDKSNAISVGATAINPYLSIYLVGLVWFARYCCKMYSRHRFSYGGFCPLVLTQFSVRTRIGKKKNSKQNKTNKPANKPSTERSFYFTHPHSLCYLFSIIERRVSSL